MRVEKKSRKELTLTEAGEIRGAVKRALKNCPTIPCPKCGGAGRVYLSAELWATLVVLQRHRKATAARVHQDLGVMVSVPAVNNRLEDLRKLGLVRRRRNGVSVVYFPNIESERKEGK